MLRQQNLLLDQREKKTIKITDFELGKLVGQGSTAKVFCARHKSSHFICAIKVMSKLKLVQLNYERRLRREIENQRGLVHPNISKLYNFSYDDDNVYLFVEYSVYGEIYKRLTEEIRFDDVTASNYIYQISSAIRYIHSKGIIHRDIKAENILLSTKNTVKISDFGLSVNTRCSSLSFRQTFCGTAEYIAPEIIESERYDASVDLWLLGILCYEFLVGQPPFQGFSRDEVFKLITKDKISFPEYLSKDAVEFISNLLQRDPKKRLALVVVKQQPWIKRNVPHWKTLPE